MDEDDMLDMEELEEYGLGYPKPKEKAGIWTFFNKILKLKDSTKTGYLDEEELRVVRLLQMTANYANTWELPVVNDYLIKDNEIILASSDSKIGFLIQSAVTQRKQLETRNRSKSKSGGVKGWFKKKEEQEAEE
jgi:hypothetical protein